MHLPVQALCPAYHYYYIFILAVPLAAVPQLRGGSRWGARGRCRQRTPLNVGWASRC